MGFFGLSEADSGELVFHYGPTKNLLQRVISFLWFYLQ
ncbi:unnamed protein product [Brassica rapa subsp. trilocularis]